MNTVTLLTKTEIRQVTRKVLNNIETSYYLKPDQYCDKMKAVCHLEDLGLMSIIMEVYPEWVSIELIQFNVMDSVDLSYKQTYTTNTKMVSKVNDIYQQLTNTENGYFTMSEESIPF